VKDVWLATSPESKARYMLTAAGEGEYQLNLAEEVLTAMMCASESQRQFCWPAVMEAFEAAGHKGWLTLEHFKRRGARLEEQGPRPGDAGRGPRPSLS
jgi:sugar phosphate isomerase/epimerase